MSYSTGSIDEELLGLAALLISPTACRAKACSLSIRWGQLGRTVTSSFAPPPPGNYQQPLIIVDGIYMNTGDAWWISIPMTSKNRGPQRMRRRYPFYGSGAPMALFEYSPGGGGGGIAGGRYPGHLSGRNRIFRMCRRNLTRSIRLPTGKCWTPKYLQPVLWIPTTDDVYDTSCPTCRITRTISSSHCKGFISPITFLFRAGGVDQLLVSTTGCRTKAPSRVLRIYPPQLPRRPGAPVEQPLQPAVEFDVHFFAAGTPGADNQRAGSFRQ